MTSPIDDPEAPATLRAACQLLTFAQVHRTVPYTGPAEGMRAFCAGTFAALHAVMADASQFEAFGCFVLGLCEEHGSLTAAQARRERRAKAGRRRAACAGVRTLVDILDAFESTGGGGQDAGTTSITVH
ncbi:hypothetical protein PPGU19_047980 [Paraburkholderia sp. PGU19]|uniref:hypothetical protein n=1 Tax=Paraburkholderia sp. PGU19 TaxID=2735434 RepID=UPI0015DA226F|nr:hypothetical protein [Paraburkholderia sp. PGU19]BCG00230.1 hypothetical protein PPGU19_047980 [Paraburkholderia sp. PGU19]